MRYSKLFGKTRREVPGETRLVSHQLLVKAGFIDQTAAGVYSFLPLGFRVLSKIDAIIKEELAKEGIQQLLMPYVSPADLWQESGRYQKMDEILAKFTSKRGQKMLLSPTHEEIITDLVRKHIHSYKDLPVILNHNQLKFRDEIRVFGGLVRTREFYMQDAYSMDRDEKGLDKSFNTVVRAYKNIFKRISIETIEVQADSGTMGGSDSHEFIAVTGSGEDVILECASCGHKANMEVVANIEKKNICPKCGKMEIRERRGIEVGHAFKLGTCYSESMNAKYLDEKGKLQLIWMGCYGVGISRLMAVVAELNHDERGLVWPESVAPFKYHLIALDEVEKQAEKVYQSLVNKGEEVLFDDRQEATAGEKFNDADLIGIPCRLVVSKKTGNKIEVKKRNSKRTELHDFNSLK